MMVNNYTKLDMSQYRQSGEGANGASYDCINDTDIMVKLYNPSYDISAIITEQEIAKKVYSLGIPSPEPGEIVTDGERIGIRFRRIVGKRSYARACADEPERTEEFTREFARCCKRLHSFECPQDMFPDAKPQLKTLLAAGTTFNAREKAVIADFIDSIPECSTVLHGDMHIGNLISTLPKGAPMDIPHDVYFIDLGYFAKGCPLIDLGMLFVICNWADPEFVEHDFHIPASQARLVWKYFSDEYFFKEDKLAEKWFGPDQTPESVYEKMKPYGVMKVLLVEYNIGFMPEGYVKHIRETFKL